MPRKCRHDREVDHHASRRVEKSITTRRYRGKMYGRNSDKRFSVRYTQEHTHRPAPTVPKIVPMVDPMVDPMIFRLPWSF